MQNTDLIKAFLSMLPMYLPPVLACLVAGVVLLANRKRASSGALWGLLGFGLLLVLCFAGPVAQTLLPRWVESPVHRVWAFKAFGVSLAVLVAVSYVFLLVAILAGRPTPDSENPPSLDCQ